MNRRRFLHFAVLTAAGPTLLAACRGSSSGGSDPLGVVPEIDPDDPLGSALRRARAMGKPLLVLTVPREDGLRSEREHELGFFFNHCDRQALLDLALCEVVAATSHDLGQHVRSVSELDEPRMWLVDTSGPVDHACAITGELPELYRYGWDSEDDYQAQESKFSASVDERNAALAAQLHAALLPNAAAGEVLAAVSLASDEPAARELLAKLEGGTRVPDPEELDRFAPLVIETIDPAKGETEAILEALSGAASARVREAPPTGAKWASSFGCGCEIEGEEDSGSLGIACGMAMIPSKASRFLLFYTTG